MCGIIGSVGKSLDREVLSILSHRGPDDSGWYEEKTVRLGHLRLSIQDVSSNAHQPFISEDGNVVLIFNGEIYNHWQIRSQLSFPEDKYRSTSDTETILRGYMELGAELFPLLNGIFALAIYDKARQEIVVVRDRFGVKPLYYMLDDEGIAFSSELKALNIQDQAIDVGALRNYVGFLWSPGENTPFARVKKLLPGTIITMSVGDKPTAKFSRFYNSGFNNERLNITEEEAIDQLEALLLKAVKRQLLSDVPVGFFLSGGLDSSILVAMAKKIKGERFTCFTIDTDDFAKQEGFANDLYYAKKVADHLGVDLEIVKADVDIARDFDKMIWHLDEPQADPAPLNVLNISKRAREMGFKVLIGGTGGDDVFSGYRRHQMLSYEKYFSWMPSGLVKLVHMLVSVAPIGSALKRRLKKALYTAGVAKENRVFSYFDWLPQSKLNDLFKHTTGALVEKTDPYGYFKKTLSEIPLEKSRLNQMLHLEMNGFLVDHNFNYTDKMSMATGIEVRVPFLDNDLVEFSQKLPVALKLKGKETKYLLKKVAERYLPHEVIYRSKAGFGAPVRKWITEELSATVDKKLSEERLRQRGVFEPRAVGQLIEDNKNNKIDASYSIWALLAIESWMEQFIDHKTS